MPNAAAPLLTFFLSLSLVASTVGAEDKPIFSGPQPGEKTTPFVSLELRGAAAGKERNVILENGGKPIALIFVHGVERSMAPIFGVIDGYGAERKETLKTEFVFLSADRLASQQQLPLVGQSLRITNAMSLSVDGIEGPGNYGLNKECLLTIVIARDNFVLTNIALVQPGIADGERIVAAMARASGDTNPPTVDQVRSLRAATNAMARPAPARTNAAAANQAIPGAAPTDANLIGLLRRFIQPANDARTVDAVLEEVRAYIKENDNLKKQAVAGWIRVIYLKYGSEYSRQAGQKFVDELSPKPAAATMP